MPVTRSARVAAALWIAWAIVVWNVVIDHVIVVAGREYIAAAIRGAAIGRFARMDDWMRPAVTRGVVSATAAAVLILAAGAVGLAAASRRPLSSPR